MPNSPHLTFARVDKSNPSLSIALLPPRASTLSRAYISSTRAQLPSVVLETAHSSHHYSCLLSHAHRQLSRTSAVPHQSRRQRHPPSLTRTVCASELCAPILRADSRLPFLPSGSGGEGDGRGLVGEGRVRARRSRFLGRIQEGRCRYRLYHRQLLGLRAGVLRLRFRWHRRVVVERVWAWCVGAC